ncbi:MAG TPA: SpoIID/LytB domain-containing protein [Propionibacteriaceae bacterium]
MSTQTRPSTNVWSCTGRLLGILVALSLILFSAATFAEPASADSAVRAKAGNFTVKGAGYGHGYGMSQYGAYGAAREGLSWKEILAFYYPGTTLGTMASGTKIKVWVTADNDGALRVLPTPGLKVTDGSGNSYTVPTGSKYKYWRIARSGSGYRLTWVDSDGGLHTVKTTLSTTTWAFHNSAKIIKLKMPNGSVREYRGSLQLAKRGSSGRTVNKVALEDYVKAVVPSEMPTSWAKDAVRTQAVAARSYAVRLRDFTSYDGYDICDTTSCQVYSGYAVTSGGRRTVRETSGGNDATKATANVIVKYKGAVALTQFASSNGGHTAQGGYKYLAPHSDPYDSVVVSQAWTRTISAASVGRAWPSIGTVSKIQVLSRDGAGKWGGRVKQIKVTGSKGSVTVAGSTFQYKFGMRSSLYTVTGA